MQMKIVASVALLTALFGTLPASAQTDDETVADLRVRAEQGDAKAQGGKGKKKGFGESFLSTTLLAEQGAVTTVLTRGLDQDPSESGKRRLAEALQAL